MDASLGNRYNEGCVVFVMGYDFYIELKKADNWHTLKLMDYRFLHEGKEPDLFGSPVIIDDEDFFVKKVLEYERIKGNSNEYYFELRKDGY